MRVEGGGLEYGSQGGKEVQIGIQSGEASRAKGGAGAHCQAWAQYRRPFASLQTGTDQIGFSPGEKCIIQLTLIYSAVEGQGVGHMIRKRRGRRPKIGAKRDKECSWYIQYRT